MKAAEKFHAASGCDGGRALRINVYRYINENQEPSRSAFYASQPPSLFNACVRDQIREYENAMDSYDEGSFKYYIKIEDERIYRQLTRLNACKR
jgi:hypothetical protein